jgi:hypothetical protein
MTRSVKVVCRCGKVCTSMRDWDQHLKKKHPKWRKQLEGEGSLAEDRQVFKETRG